MTHLRIELARWFWRLLFWCSRPERIAGVDVGILLPLTTSKAALSGKIRVALQLLKQYDPRQLARLQAHTAGVLVVDSSSALAHWERIPRLIVLDEKHVADKSTEPEHLAATLVHETTHAWLEHRGFRYDAARRTRLEALCFGAEAAFARRVPGCESLARYYSVLQDRVSEASTELWSDAALRQMRADDLVASGAPRWLVRRIMHSHDVPTA